MPLKSILCVFSGEPREHAAVSMAMGLASSQCAELVVLHIMPPLVQHPEFFGRSQIAQAVVGDYSVLETLQHDANARCETARLETNLLAQNSKLTILQGDDRPSPGTSAVRFKAARDVRDCLPREGRLTDILVLGHDSDSDDAHLVQLALATTGRPLMLVPSMPEGLLGQSLPVPVVALAWDGSLGASRALHGSLSLLRSAKDVFAICVRENEAVSDQIAEQRLVDYLSLQGIGIQIIHVSLDGKSVGEAILHKARLLGANALVMGAYGRGAVAETVFGGATRYMLAHSEINTVLSH